MVIITRRGKSKYDKCICVGKGDHKQFFSSKNSLSCEFLFSLQTGKIDHRKHLTVLHSALLPNTKLPFRGKYFACIRYTRIPQMCTVETAKPSNEVVKISSLPSSLPPLLCLFSHFLLIFLLLCIHFCI